MTLKLNQPQPSALLSLLHTNYFRPLILCVVMVCSPSWAFINYSFYTQTKSDPRMDSFLTGMLNGMLVTNAQMKVVTGKALFCLRPDIKVDLNFAIQIIEASAMGLEPDNRSSAPVDGMILKGLIDLLPCP